MDSIFETGMLVAFGAAWPVSIIKTLWTKKTSGKSLIFLAIIIVGYISGIIHKALHNLDLVILLYILNACMVTLDLALCVRYRKAERGSAGKA
ncbi:MAG: hypothetical protein FWE70_01400 [Oscillospiraceae bacterium]|nr:hypothetical protein [Oscillospiraceae bacterium]